MASTEEALRLAAELVNSGNAAVLSLMRDGGREEDRLTDKPEVCARDGERLIVVECGGEDRVSLLRSTLARTDESALRGRFPRWFCVEAKHGWLSTRFVLTSASVGNVPYAFLDTKTSFGLKRLMRRQHGELSEIYADRPATDEVAEREAGEFFTKGCGK